MDYQADVTDYVNEDFQIMFRLHSDYSVNYRGMYIDDVYLSLEEIDTDTDTDTDTETDTTTDTGTDTGEDTDTGPAFQCIGIVDPDTVPTTGGDFDVTGTGFFVSLSAELTNVADTDESYSISALDVDWHGLTSATVSAPGGMTAGTYSVTLDNGVGDPAECPESEYLYVTDSSATLAVTDVSPALVSSNSAATDKDVVITGTGFEPVPKVTWINTSDTDDTYTATLVYWNSFEELEARCPSVSQSMTPGTYTVRVTNLESATNADWGGTFTVTGNPPPIIDELDPFRAPSGDGIHSIMTGENFDDCNDTDAVKVELILPEPAAPIRLTLNGDSDTDSDTSNDGCGSETELHIYDSINPAHGQFPIRVTNADGQYDTYYYWGSTPSSDAHLTEFTVDGSTLMTPRWRHGSVEGFDPFLGSYLYTTGGESEDTDAGTWYVLDDTEIMPVSIEGTLGTPWRAQQWNGVDHSDNVLNTPRQGHAMVRADNWLFVLGGAPEGTAWENSNEPPNDTDSDTSNDTTDALATVERARILGLETRPVITGHSLDTDSGALESGIWYYRVSALGTWGESLASEPITVYNDDADDASTVRVEWDPVPEATAYNVYRNISSSGNNGATYLLADTVPTTYFEDTGGVTPYPLFDPSPLPPGSIGRWETLPNTMTKGREGLGAVVVTVAKEGGTASKFLYAVGGRPSNAWTGYLADGELTEIQADGTLAPFGALGHSLNTARAFFSLITNLGQNYLIGPSSDPGEGPFATGGEVGDLMLIAVWGDDEYEDKGNSGLKDVEVVRIIKENGAIDSWQVQNSKVSQGGHGGDSLLYFNALFDFGGVKTETLTAGPVFTGAASQRAPYDESATDDQDIILNFTAAAATLKNSRAYYQAVRLNGYIFIIGGYGTLSGLTSTIEHCPQ
jgi:hypothetical protein